MACPGQCFAQVLVTGSACLLSTSSCWVGPLTGLLQQLAGLQAVREALHSLTAGLLLLPAALAVGPLCSHAEGSWQQPAGRGQVEHGQITVATRLLGLQQLLLCVITLRGLGNNLQAEETPSKHGQSFNAHDSGSAVVGFVGFAARATTVVQCSAGVQDITVQSSTAIVCSDIHA
jgi:hypothetical protein